jgi:chromosome segregation ATPase
MAKLSELQSLWETDSKIDETNLGAEATKIPKLHAKYLNFLTSTKLNLRKAESDYNQLRRKKFRYYRGEMTREELQEESWTQWQGTKPLKNEMDEFLTLDEELNKLLDKVEYFKTVIYQLEQIIKSLNSRTWDIRNHIEWLKWSNGSL